MCDEQNTLPNGAGDVSDAKLARLEKEAKDLTQRLQVVSAQVLLCCTGNLHVNSKRSFLSMQQFNRSDPRSPSIRQNQSF